eukprot:gene18923-biopygen5456
MQRRGRRKGEKMRNEEMSAPQIERKLALPQGFRVPSGECFSACYRTMEPRATLRLHESAVTCPTTGVWSDGVF